MPDTININDKIFLFGGSFLEIISIPFTKNKLTGEFLDSIEVIVPDNSDISFDHINNNGMLIISNKLITDNEEYLISECNVFLDKSCIPYIDAEYMNPVNPFLPLEKSLLIKIHNHYFTRDIYLSINRTDKHTNILAIKSNYPIKVDCGKIVQGFTKNEICTIESLF